MQNTIYKSCPGILILVFIAVVAGCGGDEDPLLEEITVTGTLNGTVIDQATQRPLAGAEVTLDNGLSTVTDANGSYIFREIDANTYTITIAAPGYLTHYSFRAASAAETVARQVSKTAHASSSAGSALCLARPAERFCSARRCRNSDFYVGRVAIRSASRRIRRKERRA